MSIEFVSYNGEWPCLCCGNLVLRINEEEVILENCMNSGGSVYFDSDWEDHVSCGEWRVDPPDKYAHLRKEIESCVNENVPWGCCGGCV